MKTRGSSVRIVWLKNHGARITRTERGGVRRARFVRPDGAVTISEAVAALKTYAFKVYRLVTRKQVKVVKRGGLMLMPLSELRRLIKEPGWWQDWRTLKRKRGR